MNTPSPYQQVLFVGPGLRDGSQGQAFAAALRTLRGAAPNERIIDTLHSFDGLWQALQAPRQHLGEQVLVLGVAPGSVTRLHDMKRSELPLPADAAGIAAPAGKAFAAWLKQATERRNAG